MNIAYSAGAVAAKQGVLHFLVEGGPWRCTQTALNKGVHEEKEEGEKINRPRGNDLDQKNLRSSHFRPCLEWRSSPC